MELNLEWIYLTSLVALIACSAGVGLSWAIFKPGWMGFDGHTLWDWLVLLAVPTVLGLATLLISEGQTSIAQQRAEEEALQQYIDRISELALDGHFSDRTPEAVAVGRAQTLAVLQIIDGGRAGRVLHFLDEIGLVQLLVTDIEGLDFEGAELKGLSLSGVEMEDVDLSGADLEEADLAGADLEGADLRDADLKGTNLAGADLEGALLDGAQMSHADLRGANLAGASGLDRDRLERACLDEHTVLPPGLSVTAWTGCSGEIVDDD